MPYKDPRVQLNLKLAPEDYAALAAEAAFANTVVSRYARHLLLQRQAQPLSKAAHYERQEARVREATLRKQMAALEEQIHTLEAASADRQHWQRRAQILELELAQAEAELADPARITALIRQEFDAQKAAEAAKRDEE